MVDNGAEYYAKFIDGDNSYIGLIISEYREGLMMYLYRFTNDIDFAEDLTEDTFVKLYAKKPKFSGKCSFKTWLYTIGRNIAIDYRRRHPFTWVSFEKCSDMKADTDVEARFEKTEQNAELSRAMQKLKLEYRQVLHLVYIEGLSTEETGKIMKKNSKQIGNLLYRAKGALRNILGKEETDNEKQ